MYSKLASPTNIQLDFGTVQATHVAHSFGVDAPNDMVTSNIQYGVEVDGTFRPIPGSAQFVNIRGADFDDLVQNTELTPADIRAKHLEVADRQAKANQAAADEAQAAAQKAAQQAQSATAALATPANPAVGAAATKPLPAVTPAAANAAGPVVGG